MRFAVAVVVLMGIGAADAQVREPPPAPPWESETQSKPIDRTRISVLKSVWHQSALDDATLLWIFLEIGDQHSRSRKPDDRDLAAAYYAAAANQSSFAKHPRRLEILFGSG